MARVTRVEPSLQAAFVEYGGNRQGFLAFSEIHPDYYRIPVEDREKLLSGEIDDLDTADQPEASDKPADETPSDDANSDDAPSNDEVDEVYTIAADTTGEEQISVDVSEDGETEKATDNNADNSDAENGDAEGGDNGDSDNGDEDDEREARRRFARISKHYKIQEVISRRQILLIQVVKEERGNKARHLPPIFPWRGGIAF